MILCFPSGNHSIAVSVRGDWSDAVGNYESKQKMCCNAPGTPAAYSTQMKLKLDDPDVRFENSIALEQLSRAELTEYTLHIA